MSRTGQFFRAVRAKLTERDKAYIKKHLPPKGQELFWGMNLADQYHALHVAYTAERLAMREPEPPDMELLIRCALLHDVGRRRGDMGILGKVLAVLLHALAPNLAWRWAQEKKKGFLCCPRHVMYVYYHHPAIGARLLERAGFVGEAAVVGLHHQPPCTGDSPLLRLLRRADEMN